MPCDYYKTLGLSRGVSPERIRRRFHELALRHHPDRAGDEQTARFQAIVEAYQALCRPEARNPHAPGTEIPVRQAPPRRPASPGPAPEPLVGSRPRAPTGVLHSELQSGSPTPRAPTFREEPVDAELVLDAADLGRPVRVLLAHPAPCPSCAKCDRARCGGDLFCSTCGGLGQIELQRTVRLVLPPEIRPGMVIPVEIPGLGPLRLRLRPRFW